MLVLLSVFVDGDFATAIADLVLGIVDAAELAGGDALDRLVAVDMVAFVVECDGSVHEVVHMAHLEGNGEIFGVRSER